MTAAELITVVVLKSVTQRHVRIIYFIYGNRRKEKTSHAHKRLALSRNCYDVFLMVINYNIIPIGLTLYYCMILLLCDVSATLTTMMMMMIDERIIFQICCAQLRIARTTCRAQDDVVGGNTNDETKRQHKYKTANNDEKRVRKHHYNI